MVKKTTSSKRTKTQPKVVIENKETKTSMLDFLKFGESYTSLILGIIVVIVATILLLSFIKTRGASNRGSNNPEISQQLTQEQAQRVQLDLTEGPTISPSVTPTVLLTPTALPKATVAPTVIQKKVIVPTATPKIEKKQVAQKPQANGKSGKTYTVVAGDSLWTIAEKQYKSGYNWVDIARVNNLSNPGDIHSGNKLIIPDISPKLATVTVAPTVTVPTPSQAQVQKTTDSTISLNKITGTTYAVEKGDNLWSIAVRAYGDGYMWTKIAQANGLTDPGLIFSGNVLKIPRG